MSCGSAGREETNPRGKPGAIVADDDVVAGFRRGIVGVGSSQLGGRGRHLGEIVAVQVFDAEHAEEVVDDRGRELDVRRALRRAPCGSKRVNVNCSTNVSSGTPYCRPTDTAMAKQFMSERKAAPSLCMSMKISPSVPSSYSPGAQEDLVPADLALPA